MAVCFPYENLKRPWLAALFTHSRSMLRPLSGYLITVLHMYETSGRQQQRRCEVPNQLGMKRLGYDHRSHAKRRDPYWYL